MHRSRGGCQNCKKRKRRCDESRPACQACQKRGLECRGYDVVLRWTNGIASRGRLAGATTFATAAESSSAASARSDSAAPQQHQDGAAVATAPVALSPHEARLSDAPATAPHEDGSSFDGNWASPAITATSYEGAPGPGSSNRDDCSPYAQSTPISGPDNTKQELFDRFELELVEANTSGGPRASLLHPVISSGFQRLYATRTGSWLEPYMAAMAQESDALFHVLVAIQAFLEDGLTVSSMDFIDQALQKFRLELAQPRNARTRATMTAGLLVCTIQLLQARPWTSYLQLIAGLYRLGGDMDQLPSDLDLRDAHALHTVEVLAVMDMPVFVVGRTSPSIGVWQRLRAVQNRQRHGGQQHGGEGEGEGAPGGVEQISGVPRSLLDVFARIPEGPSGEVERDLWYWEGEIGEIPQSHLWDAWRYSGMLSIRHQRRLRAKAGEREALREGGSGGAGGKAPLPADSVLLCRLISSMDSLLQSLDRPEYGHLLVFNSMRYPLVAASLQVSLLEAYPDWKMLLKRVRSRFSEMDSTGVGVMDVLSELLDEVWKSGVDDFDIDKAAMSRGVEIALF